MVMVYFVEDALWNKVQALEKDLNILKTECRSKCNKNLTKINEVFAILKEDRQNPMNEDHEEFLALLPDFPLSSKEEYFDFNTRLENDEEIRKYFVSII